jgi:hypothetical protein
MQAMLTSGNVGDGEVWQGCIKGPGAPDLANSRCDGLNLDVMPFDHEHARSAGKLRADARYKDLALAQPTERADRKWADYDVGCKFEVMDQSQTMLDFAEITRLVR